MSPELLTAWKVFLTGHWTRTTPTSPGTYRVCSVDGNPETTSATVTLIRDPQTHEVVPLFPWGGWWWSEPLPPLPPLDTAPLRLIGP